jgi:hypothetical protein
MSNEKQTPFDEAIMAMPEHWRYRWCGGGPCGCMGAANCSGGMSGKGFTHEQWEEWVSKNPDPNPPKPFDPEEFRRALEPYCQKQPA